MVRRHRQPGVQHVAARRDAAGAFGAQHRLPVIVAPIKGVGGKKRGQDPQSGHARHLVLAQGLAMNQDGA